MTGHRQPSGANAVSILLGLASEVQTLDLAEVVLDIKQSSPPNSGYGVTGSSHFRHSPRAARSCRSSCGHPGRPGRSGTAGTPASASVSGRGCSGLVGYCATGETEKRKTDEFCEVRCESVTRFHQCGSEMVRTVPRTDRMCC